MKAERPAHVKLLQRLPKEDYDAMVGSCDVGMIFLDHRFTIPNFPSRLLSYMQAKLPVLAVTDPNTDIGKVIIDGGFGWWCEGSDVNVVLEIIESIIKSNVQFIGDLGMEYLGRSYNSTIVYKKIIKERIIR